MAKGIKINASQAALLVECDERIVRGWILAAILRADKGPDGRWIIDTNDLLRVKYLDRKHRTRIDQWVHEQISPIAAAASLPTIAVSTSPAEDITPTLNGLIRQQEIETREVQEVREAITSMEAKFDNLISQLHEAGLKVRP